MACDQGGLEYFAEGWWAQRTKRWRIARQTAQPARAAGGFRVDALIDAADRSRAAASQLREIAKRAARIHNGTRADNGGRRNGAQVSRGQAGHYPLPGNRGPRRAS